MQKRDNKIRTIVFSVVGLAITVFGSGCGVKEAAKKVVDTGKNAAVFAKESAKEAAKSTHENVKNLTEPTRTVILIDDTNTTNLSQLSSFGDIKKLGGARLQKMKVGGSLVILVIDPTGGSTPKAIFAAQLPNKLKPVAKKKWAATQMIEMEKALKSGGPSHPVGFTPLIENIHSAMELLSRAENAPNVYRELVVTTDMGQYSKLITSSQIAQMSTDADVDRMVKAVHKQYPPLSFPPDKVKVFYLPSNGTNFSSTEFETIEYGFKSLCYSWGVETEPEITHPNGIKVSARGDGSGRMAAVQTIVSRTRPDIDTIYSARSTSAGPFGVGADGHKTLRHWILLLDISGSMEGKKLDIAQKELSAALSRLRPGETFNIVAFAGTVTKTFNTTLVSANAQNTARASNWLQQLTIGDGTNLENAFRTAFEVPAANEVILISDGEPSEGITDSAEMREFVSKINERRIPIHIVAVGLAESAPVDTMGEDNARQMLRLIADDSGGQYNEILL